ncbi:MAG TPA: hypothetical protein DHV89_04085, partial [Ruminococcus sp.]|nr:hypothetical protein [Ruminococcus sp.]
RSVKPAARGLAGNATNKTIWANKETDEKSIRNAPQQDGEKIRWEKNGGGKPLPYNNSGKIKKTAPKVRS